jgi:thymidylate kinase
LSGGNLAASWRQRRSIVPAGRRRGPLGHRARGVVVATVGTDGSGKSTVADTARARLEALGFTTRTAYFGMARGNLPGVGLARKVLRIPAPGGEDKSAVEPAEVPDPGTPPADHQALRRVAAWYYAVEYGWRYLTSVAGPRRRGEVVVCDRYVYDLRDSPWPGSKAAGFAQWLVPAPDILILPDAPAEMIHARKPERPFAEQRAQQEKFRLLVAEGPGTSANLVVDTSGQTPDAVAPLVRAIISAAHLDPAARS